ncbi:ABC-2 family transporter protein [Candidatus Daviesbacteria bacterium]|nr:ABC-2 family transporter protein [Candidatus Daviesbacteria bacterium]
MGKYISVFRIAWQQNLIYRLNFVLWRFRSVMQLLLVYFIWWSVFQSQKQIFGYTASSILTYILIAALIRAIVLSTRVTDLIDSINSGSVVNFLIKPLGFVKYYLARDIADKLFNILFYIGEVSVLVFLLKPAVIIQTNIQVLAYFIFAIAGGLVIYFCINFLISLTAFWMENSWGPLFLIGVLLETLGGGLFPLDILPREIFNILMITPFPYLIYFPSKIYLGGMRNAEILYGFSIISAWIITLIILTKLMISSGFRHFSAEGN